MKKSNRRTLESAGVKVIHPIKDAKSKKVFAYYGEVDLESLCIAAYQRGITKAVERIEREFEPQAVGALSVSYRPRANGDLWLWDGYQRSMALMNMGYTTAKAEICTGLRYQDEARLFFNVNDTSSNMSGWLRFKAAHTAGNDIYRRLIKVAKASGLTTPLCRGIKKCSHADIKSPSMLLEPFNRGGFSLVSLQCKVIRNCWKHAGHLDNLAKRIEFTRGLSTFLKAHTMSKDPLPYSTIELVLGNISQAKLLKMAKKEKTNRADSAQYFSALCGLFGKAKKAGSPDSHLKYAA